MAFSSHFKRNQALLGAAESYFYLGYSVIPVYGDRDLKRAKVAAVDWKKYQSQRAQAAQFEAWFADDHFGGLAIVTGRISRLMVLDFDDADLAAEFASRYPHLTDTRTVQSAGRGLPHYYYRLPGAMHVESMSAAGVDLQADGRYVIAPPTCIDGNVYQVIRGGEPHCVTPAQLRIIRDFVRDQRVKVTSQLDVHSSESVPDTTPSETDVMISISPSEAISLYRYHAEHIGRNNALFKTALRLRDSGWARDDVETCLIVWHIQQPAVSDHSPETAKQREAEARRTIRSAFSRPARKRSRSSDESKGLPNSLREHLLQRDEAALLRVLDGLRLENAQAGMLLTEKGICEALSGEVGRYSVRKALAMTFDDETPIFREYEMDDDESNPSLRLSSHTYVASANADRSNNKCLLFRATASDKTRGGRPPTYYVMPSIEVLCAKFGVKYTKSDPIKRKDLGSPKAYRQALQREFIKRSPGMYPRKWMANRLGISVRTCQRYHQDIDLKQRPMYFREAIRWHNLDKIPESNDIYGVFLQDYSGKRYPPVQAIARKLLAQGTDVYLMRQDVNYYWHAQGNASPLMVMGVHPKVSEPDAASIGASEDTAKTSSAPPKTWANPYSTDDMARATTQNTRKTAPTDEKSAKNAISPTKERSNSSDTAPEPYQPKAKRYYKRPLPSDSEEYMAMRLYRKIRQRCEGKTGYLSKARARRLVDEYGQSLVKKLVALLTWRDGIDNPAGFAIVWLRSESKTYRNK